MAVAVQRSSRAFRPPRSWSYCPANTHVPAGTVRPVLKAARTACGGHCQSARAAFIIALATGAASPLPLTSERAASDCSTTTATATCLPVACEVP